MNNNSVICRFIAEHPDNWETLLTDDYGIKIKKEEELAIFNYGVEVDFADPVVQESRGIIIDREKLEVVCWPFRKFGNHNESYADPIDWDSAAVLEKIDGSIIKLWYDHGKGRWQFSTNGMIRAENSSVSNSAFLSFGDVIKKADNYADIPFGTLDLTNTYIFELVSPETRVVVEYPRTHLYHIGTRNNITGIESYVDIGIEKPRRFALCSLDDCIKAAIALNSENEDNSVSDEGFVVVDKHYNRVKVKSPDYIALHRLRQTYTLTKKECVQRLLSDPEELREMCDANPSLIPLVKYYDYRLAELMHTCDTIGVLAKSLLAEYSGDRKAVAKLLLRHRLSFIGFRCLDSDVSGREALLAYPVEKIVRYFPDYEAEDIYSVFSPDGK